MIRSDVLKWAAIALVAIFAFMLLPTYEYFTPNEPIGTTLGVLPLSINKGEGGEPPVCSWETKEGKAPKDEPKSYLSGTEYKVLEKAKIDCSMDKKCKGLLSRSKPGNVTTYFMMSTDVLESHTGSDKVEFHKKKDGGCSKDPKEAPCEWSEPKKDQAPKQDTLNFFFPTLYTAQIGCAERSDCKGITKDDETNFYYLSNGDELKEKKGKTFYKKKKCHDNHEGDKGDDGGDDDDDWHKLETREHGYSPGDSTSDPPIGDIINGYGAYNGDGMGAGAGYGPGAMYGRSGSSGGSGGGRARPWFQGSEEDNYIAKSALVPCTCTTHSMGCPKHAGGRDHSKAPGDMDKDGMPNQYGIMKPFSKAFANQEEPSGFLNAFNAFMR
jgi:hypothetical protein